MNDSIHPLGLTAALIFAAGLATACTDTVSPTPYVPPPAATASDTSAQSSLVGTVPAEPTKDTHSTTSAAKSDISKMQQSDSMPMPGQANDHSTLSPKASQKLDVKTP